MEESQQRFQPVQLKDGSWTLHDRFYGETYHPELGAVGEARHLYLEQGCIAERLKSGTGQPLVVWDCGLGAAGNACALIALWKEFPEASLELHSFDLSTGALEESLRHPEKFPWLETIPKDQWENLLQEHHLAEKGNPGRLDWHWHLGDFSALITSPQAGMGRPHILFYDFHSPAKNWNVWPLGHWRALRRHCRDEDDGGTLVISHSRSTALRTTLLLAGFHVGRGCALGPKEETTLASTTRRLLADPLDQEWLQRAFRSTASHPFEGDTHHPRPLEEPFLSQIRNHPQFTQDRSPCS